MWLLLMPIDRNTDNIEKNGKFKAVMNLGRTMSWKLLPRKWRWLMSDDDCQVDEMQIKLNNVGWRLLSGHEQIEINDEKWWMPMGGSKSR